MERIGTLETVCRYPVKSMAGEAVPRAFVGFAGIMGDRTYAFVRQDGPKGFPWLTGRELEQLVLFRPRFLDGAGSELPVEVEKSFAMPPGVRPVFPSADAFAVDVTTPAGRTLPVTSPELKADLEARAGCEVRLSVSDRSHVDCRPLSLFANASALGLAGELGVPVDRRRFRANFYVDWDDARPYRDDDLVGRTLQVGERARVAVLERDPRCKMITLDPDTGEQQPQLLRHLIKSRDGTAGTYAAVLVEGVVAPGDPIWLI